MSPSIRTSSARPLESSSSTIWSVETPLLEALAEASGLTLVEPAPLLPEVLRWFRLLASLVLKRETCEKCCFMSVPSCTIKTFTSAISDVILHQSHQRASDHTVGQIESLCRRRSHHCLNGLPPQPSLRFGGHGLQEVVGVVLHEQKSGRLWQRRSNSLLAGRASYHER